MDPDTLGPAGDRRRFEVLVVCTANLCRSPMIEALLRAELAGRAGDWSVGSAGTHAEDGRPVHPLTARALAGQGLALPADWRSHRLGRDEVARADLVLTASRSHRSETLRTEPRAATRTFTLRQFLRLLRTPDADAPDGGRHAHPGELLLESALAARGLGPPVPPAADDIPDPVGRPYAVFRELADDLADEIAAGLRRPGRAPLTGPLASIRPAPGTPRPSVPDRPAPWWAAGST